MFWSVYFEDCCCLSHSHRILGSIVPQTNPQAHSAEHRPSDSSQTSDRPHAGSLESSRSVQQLRSPLLGPERGRVTQRSKKPGLPRRASANMQGPHRGQEFSVDDDVTEIEDDLASRQTNILGATSSFSTVRHQPSSLRRRPAAQPTLPRVDSSHKEEAVAEAGAEVMDAAGGRGEGFDDDHASERAEEDTIRAEPAAELDDDCEDDEADLSDAE